MTIVTDTDVAKTRTALTNTNTITNITTSTLTDRNSTETYTSTWTDPNASGTVTDTVLERVVTSQESADVEVSAEQEVEIEIVEEYTAVEQVPVQVNTTISTQQTGTATRLK